MVGVVLMLLGAPLWTGLLVNLGMLGLAIEVPVRRFKFTEARTSLMWLLIPFAYFGWYGIIAYNDNKALQNLRAEYDTSNANVSVPFDPENHSLVLFGGAENYADALTQDFGLPVAYAKNENVSEGYLSTRIIEHELCTRVRNEPLMKAAFIYTFGFHYEDRSGYRQLESRFCSLRMPEQPKEKFVSVSTSRTETSISGLPVKLIENHIGLPDGREFVLRGGTAAPYPWFPKPVLGCALNSGAPNWDCFHGFSRNSFTPIVSSATRHGGDVRVLAKALGLMPTDTNDRAAVHSEILEDKLQQITELQLEHDVQALKEAVADPSSQLSVHSVRVLEQSSDILLPMAPLIVDGIKRAAQISDNPYRNSETGRTLARLFGKLPPDVQDKYADDMSLLYERADQAGNGHHWLYRADELIRYRKPLAYAPPELIAK